MGLINRIKQTAVTLRFSILSIFIALFLVTMLAIIVVTTIRFEKTLTFTSFERMHQASLLVSKQLQDIVDKVVIETRMTADLIQDGVLDIHDEFEIVAYSYNIIRTLELGRSTYWADTNGFFIGSRKREDGSIINEMYEKKPNSLTYATYPMDKEGHFSKIFSTPPMDYDPRTRPWYIVAKDAKQFAWSDPYLFVFGKKKQIGIAAGIPIYKSDGSLEGVFGISVPLKYIDLFLHAENISKNSQAFIIDSRGNLIAFPGLENFVERSSKSLKLPQLSSLSMPWLEMSLDTFNQTGQTSFSLDYNGKTYLFHYQPITFFNKKNWYIVIAIPKSDFTGDLEKMNLIVLIVCLIILGISVFVVSNLINRVIKPIIQLVKETRKIKNFELDEDINITSRIKEVMYLTNAISSMKSGLQSFQKYIPKVLVRQLIETHQHIQIGGEKKELVVFFSDIKNFTSIAEIMDPNELMLYLCDYFEALTQIIIKNGGTIDKYIGDSIMAFWGAPIPVVEPVEQAARAAILCQKKLIEFNQNSIEQKKYPLETRIGMHLGDCIVGNIGSSERLNYTVIGDTTNIASRLENINKVYGTNIIVSEAIYQVLKDKFIMRMLDHVAVKGKTQSCYIYELLAEISDEVPFDIHLYQEVFANGFSAYRQQHFDEAIEFFKQCLQIYSNDTVAPIFIKRCMNFKSNPPNKNWDGLWEAFKSNSNEL